MLVIDLYIIFIIYSYYYFLTKEQECNNLKTPDYSIET